ncbi:MAG: fumarylacetoacetate hydrolase family protein, partial [Sphingomonas sp.]
MKLVRFGPVGKERPGIFDDQGQIRDLSGVVADIGPEVLSPVGLARLAALDLAALPVVTGLVRYGPPVAVVPKFIAIGLNYSDHAAESGMAAPEEPVIFMKATSCIQGPDDDVVLPPGSVKSDWEVELGVVIGSRASHVALVDALAHVAGYCTVNDLSEREY